MGIQMWLRRNPLRCWWRGCGCAPEFLRMDVSSYFLTRSVSISRMHASFFPLCLLSNICGTYCLHGNIMLRIRGFIKTRCVPVSWQSLVMSQNYVQMLYPEGVPLPPYEHHRRITHFLLTPHLLPASLKKRFHNFTATFILFSPKLAICLVPFFVWWLDLIWFCFF